MKRVLGWTLGAVLALGGVACDDEAGGEVDAATMGGAGGDGGMGGGEGGVGGGEGGEGGAPAPDGESLFVARCAACHGPEGEGSETAPQVQSPVRPYASYVIRSGRNDMPDFPAAMPAYDADAVPDAELEAILDYLAEAPQPPDGAGLYGRYCANCHGPGATGGRSGHGLRGEDLGEFRALVRAGHGGTAYDQARRYMPAWTADALTDAEVELIHAYVGEL